jgi:hypothetical protein
MIFVCEKCDACFKSNCDLTRHLNKKIPCGKEEKEIYDIIKRTCQYCEVLYADVKGVGKHMKICPLRPNETDELKQIIVQLSNKINEQSNKITEQNDKLDEIKEKIDKPNITNVNIQQNIIVTPFGKEDISFLTLKDYKKIFNKGCYSIPEILKLIHCNENKPEFMNVYIKNFKDEYMFTFDGKDWDIEKKDDVLNNMIENKKNLLESKFDDMQSELPQYAITMFKKFLERSDNDEVKNSIKDELKNMFYKNRNHVMKTIKKPKQITCNEDIKSIINVEVCKKPKKINSIKKN